MICSRKWRIPQHLSYFLPRSPFSIFSEASLPEDAGDDEQKSRNQRKRDARRAVRWGMDISAFPTTTIRRILRAVSVGEEVFEAFMLVKRLGRDVREGKRRQYNFIGKLLRDVKPEVMEPLIEALRNKEQSRFLELSGSEPVSEEEEKEENISQFLYEDQGESYYSYRALRWFKGLVNKDIHISNEVYSINIVDFDRQELRKLVHGVQLQKSSQVNKRSLADFLYHLSNALPIDQKASEMFNDGGAKTGVNTGDGGGGGSMLYEGSNAGGAVLSVDKAALWQITAAAFVLTAGFCIW